MPFFNIYGKSFVENHESIHVKVGADFLALALVISLSTLLSILHSNLHSILSITGCTF